jgi:RNA polymerase sigma factor (sigma-70 family)
VVDRAKRDALVLEHRPLAHLAAMAVRRRMPPWVDLQDLDQNALVGLIKAADNYEPVRGVPFAAYAWLVVYGYTWEQYRRARYADEVAPHGRVGENLSEPSISEDDLDEIQRAERVRRALATLAPRDQRVANLHYGDELLLREIGQRLGVNESRACQLNKRMLRRMRDALEGAGVRDGV